MALLLDTNIAIHLRDGDGPVAARAAQAQDALVISIITQIELIGGVWREPAFAAMRRARLDVMLQAIPVLPFDAAAAAAYGAILAQAGSSRRKLLDRMIAAQALAIGATLVTRNAADFADVPGLALATW
ncbi:MAG: PIN domain-containing protein [Caulobacterales bacterium]